MLTAACRPFPCSAPRSARASAGSSGFSIVDNVTFNGSTSTDIDTRYGGRTAARALLCRALPHHTMHSCGAAIGVVWSFDLSSFCPCCSTPAGPAHPSPAPAPARTGALHPAVLHTAIL